MTYIFFLADVWLLENLNPTTKYLNLNHELLRHGIAFLYHNCYTDMWLKGSFTSSVKNKMGMWSKKWHSYVLKLDSPREFKLKKKENDDDEIETN